MVDTEENKNKCSGQGYDFYEEQFKGSAYDQIEGMFESEDLDISKDRCDAFVKKVVDLWESEYQYIGYDDFSFIVDFAIKPFRNALIPWRVVSELEKLHGIQTKEQKSISLIRSIGKIIGSYAIPHDMLKPNVKDMADLWFDQYQHMKIRDFTMVITTSVNTLNCGEQYGLLVGLEIQRRQQEELKNKIA